MSKRREQCAASPYEHIMLWRSSSRYADSLRRSVEGPSCNQPRAQVRNLFAWCVRFGAEVEEEKQGGAGLLAGSAAEEGSNLVPSPVTLADWQDKHLDEQNG